MQSSIDTLSASELPINNLWLATARVVIRFTSPLSLFADFYGDLSVQTPAFALRFVAAALPGI
jgi:hypothetical protein